MTLSYPVITPTLTVTLRNPVLGDSVIVPLKSNLHITMSGMAVTTKRTVGFERLLMTVESICDVTALIAFVRTVKGNDCKLTRSTDIWIGKFVTNPVELTHQYRNGHSVTLEFQGVKQ